VNAQLVPAGPAPQSAESPASPLRSTVAIATVLAAVAMVVLDGAITNLALPTIASALHVSPALSVLIITAYQTALLMALLPFGALGEIIGFRRTFTLGLALFTAGACFSALAPSLGWLLAARFAQGLGGAAILALAVAILRHTVASDRLTAAIGWNALTVALTAAAGPTLGALILSAASWRWLFALALPVGLTAMLASRALPDVRPPVPPEVPPEARRLDGAAMALNAALFGALVAGLEMLAVRPAIACALLALFALLLVLLLRRELPKAAPLIPLDLLRQHAFRIAISASVCCFAGQTLGMLALSFYLQHGLAQTPWMAGLYMTPWPVTVAMAAPVAGKLADRRATAWLCAIGGQCLAAGLTIAALLPLHGDPRPLAACAMLCGLGFGLFQVPNNRTLFLAAPRARSGAAGAMQATARLMGQAAGAVVMTLLFTWVPIAAAPRTGLAIGAGLTALAGMVSLLRAGATPIVAGPA